MKNKLEIKILKELNKRYHKYKARLKQLKEYENKKLEVPQALGIIGGIAGVGAALGSPLPGVGNAIGAAAGAVVGIIAATSTAIDYKRKSKKLAHAHTVLDTLKSKESAEKIFSSVAKKIAKTKKDNLVEYSDHDISKAAKLLARDAIAGLKKCSKVNALLKEEDIKKSLLKGAKNGESKKAGRERLFYKQGLFAVPAAKKDNDVVYLSKKYA